jgi:hypothetical protein
MNCKNLGRCCECGGKVSLIAKAGRTREVLKGIHVNIPADFGIPTCEDCGDESMVPEVSGPLDFILINHIRNSLASIEDLSIIYQQKLS